MVAGEETSEHYIIWELSMSVQNVVPICLTHCGPSLEGKTLPCCIKKTGDHQSHWHLSFGVHENLDKNSWLELKLLTNRPTAHPHNPCVVKIFIFNITVCPLEK